MGELPRGRMDAVEPVGRRTAVASGRHRSSFKWAGVAGGFVTAIVAAEVVLRAMGQQPARTVAQANRPVFHEPDDVLGWRTKPGRYVLPSVRRHQPPTTLTVLDDASRVTRARDTNGRPLLVAVGCSFTRGFELSDEETFPWKLQRQHPEWNVRNFGTDAYSTYQSLLQLERLYARGTAPAVVIYGFIEHHERRNAATADWLRFLATASKGTQAALPYCTLDNEGRLVRHAARRHLVLPLRGHLAIIPAIERIYMRAVTTSRDMDRRRVTEKLIAAMADLCRMNGTQFVVAILAASDTARQHYAAYFENNHIRAVDCVYPASPDLVIWKGEVHPNGKRNSLYAACIDQEIRKIAVTTRPEALAR